MTGRTETDALRPLALNLDMLVRGTLAVSAIGAGTTVVLLEALYVVFSVNADNEWLKRLGFAHQAYAVVSAISLSLVFDAAFLPIMYFTARAYLRSHWKMALFSSLLWIAQIALMNHQKTLPDSTTTIPGDIIAILSLGYLALRWRRIAVQP